MEETKTLVHRRGQIKARMTRFKAFFNSFTEQQDLIQLRLRLSKFEECWSEFEQVQSLLEFQDQDQSHTAERDDFETNYFDLLAEVETYISTHTVSTGPIQTVQHSEGHTSAHIKLPTLSVPSFNGSYDQWLTFHDTFNSMIHSNSALAAIQKFHYLKSALKGDAAQVIDSLEITTDNYETAWSLLRERYENKRWIIQSHTRALFELPGLNKESHIGLRQLLDNTLKHLRALKTLKQPVEAWDTLIVHLTSTKFDHITKREWETSVAGNGNISMTELTKFLTHRCQLLEALDQGKTPPKHQPVRDIAVTKGKVRGGQYLTSHLSSNKLGCPVCRQNHPIYQCNEFLKLAIDQRQNKAMELRLCFNCLRGNHRADKCESGVCKKCSKRHNTMLHLEKSVSSAGQESHVQPVDQESAGLANKLVAHHSGKVQANTRPYIILSTAVVEILDKHGETHSCRALLDSGSQSNFITESMVRLLRLKPSSWNIPVTGISSTVVPITESVMVHIKSRYNAFQSDITCLILPKITENLPLVNFDLTLLRIPENLKLADPQPGISSGVDLLIGAELFYDLLCVGQIKSARNIPILQKTQLGWVLSGGLGTNCHTSTGLVCSLALDDQVTKFWQLEEIAETPSLTAEEQACETHFCQTHRRDASGRFVVKLPVRSSAGPLGHTRESAVKRLYSLERRLTRHPSLKQRYIEFMREYEVLGHMERVPQDQELDTSLPTCYLPHHSVIKESSSTTKLRVVFDGSAESSTGVSLNSILMVGPTIQQDLYSLLTRFRTHQVVLTADITKMYRQILVDNDDRDLQRIVWRENPDQPIAAFRLSTVTYGTASAPFLATRCLTQTAVDGKDNFPIASVVAVRDFYVDDLLTGCGSLQEAFTVRDQLMAMLAGAGLELRKWASNMPELLADLPSELVDTSTFQVDSDEHPKTLGLSWNCKGDSLEFAVQPFDPSIRTTKRNILSAIARIFDPLGLIGPVILMAKIIMQKLWQLRLGWDESVPLDVHTTWSQFSQQMSHINSLTIPRKVIGDETSSQFQLHGFCDASEAAYGASLYIRSANVSGASSTALLCSKSRVAPLKNISLPRLELCGALLLARLAHKTLSTLGLEITKCYFWTDSTIVLAWLKAPSNTWKTFVSNRVSEIQTLTDARDWNHISTHDNPADHVSRGLSAVQLLTVELWWRGPAWLDNDSDSWPSLASCNDVADPPERRSAFVGIAASQNDSDLMNNFSSLSKLHRIATYCLRFRTNCSSSDKQYGPLSVKELQYALELLIKVAQRQGFHQEIETLAKKGNLKSNSKLLSLHPFLDDHGIIRVGGRLQNAPISYAQKHPILLPPKHTFTRLLVKHEHIKQLHAGPQLLLASLRTKYWPISARNLVRQVVHDCVKCFRTKPVVLEQFMGSLPSGRVTPARPFLTCGVDYCGPFGLKIRRRRGCTTFKTYIAIFICFVTKAVHLEVVNDLTTEAFLSTLKRFIARRGKCLHIYSDNATNFVGARGELLKFEHFMSTREHQNSVAGFLATENITWHMIPARSPHFGGLWEAAVRSAKHHLKRVAGVASLTYDEMTTLITQVESCLNSRPLTPMSDDPTDLNALTPGHFLIGAPLTAIPEPELMTTSVNRLSHWQRIQQLTQHFWARWSVEYLSQLQQRMKWKVPHQLDVTPGSLVLLKDDNLPPLRWSLGRILATHPGHDGLIRVVSVKTQTGTVKRAISKICILPSETLGSCGL